VISTIIDFIIKYKSIILFIGPSNPKTDNDGNVNIKIYGNNKGETSITSEAI
jgi:hypothetical protein